MSDFEKQYLSVANKPDAPNCTTKFVNDIYARLISCAPVLDPIAYPILASIAVGARRPDIVHHLFEAAIGDTQDNERILYIYHQFSGAIITIWPSVGGPWCNPAMMSLANILKCRNFGPVERLSSRPPIGNQDIIAGNELLNERYTVTKDPQVQHLLSTYCPDFDNLTRAVALGYCHVGTTNTGIFKEHETELALAAALAGSGATRSATVHAKTALVLGNSIEAVKAVYQLAEEINNWNMSPYQPVDFERILSDLSL